MKKTRKNTAIILVLGMLVSMTACGDSAKLKDTNVDGLHAKNIVAEAECEEGNYRELDDEFVSSCADFSIDLFKTSSLEGVKAGDNVLLSPCSVLFALSMTANGAANDTLSQMEEVIASDIDISVFNEYMHSFNKRLTDASDMSFNMANSIWIKDDEEQIKVKEEFLKVCGGYYDADVMMAAFDDSTVEDINLWVRGRTNKMIPTLLDELPDSAVMYLLNAIAFEGEWEKDYEESQIDENGEFTNYAGEKQAVNMLWSTEDIYIEDEDARGFIKYYKGGEYAFMALLPNDEEGLYEYLNNMSGERFLTLLENKEYCDVITKLPEFSYDYETELSEACKSMGMDLPFMEDADFSNMAETGTGLLFINRILHKTFIQVDRAGTKAAAVTAVEMVDESAVFHEEPLKAVILDRPFIYAIIDTDTGMPIFIGVLNFV